MRNRCTLFASIVMFAFLLSAVAVAEVPLPACEDCSCQTPCSTRCIVDDPGPGSHTEYCDFWLCIDHEDCNLEPERSLALGKARMSGNANDACPIASSQRDSFSSFQDLQLLLLN